MIYSHNQVCNNFIGLIDTFNSNNYYIILKETHLPEYLLLFVNGKIHQAKFYINHLKDWVYCDSVPLLMLTKIAI